jgi:hypothetical protein
MTDIELDTPGPDQVRVTANYVEVAGHDFLLSHGDRLRPGAADELRRALVHDFDDTLTLNYNGDYPGGVRVVGNLEAGSIRLNGEDLAEAVSQLQAQVRELREAVFPFADVASRLRSDLLAAVERALEVHLPGLHR